MKKTAIFTLLMVMLVSNFSFAVQLEGDSSKVKLNYIRLLESPEQYQETLNKYKTDIKRYKINKIKKDEEIKVNIHQLLTSKLINQTLWKINITNISENKIDFNSDTFNITPNSANFLITNKTVADIEDLKADENFIIYLYTKGTKLSNKVTISLMDKKFDFKLKEQ